MSSTTLGKYLDSIGAGTIVSDRTVDVHITRLRKKLGPYADNIGNRPGFGYYFDDKLNNAAG